MPDETRPDFRSAIHPLAVTINGWWRACLVGLGLAGLGSGGAAVFGTQLEAGPVALLAVSLVLLLIGAGGRLPSRLKVGENEAAWEAVEGFVSRVADEVPSEQAPQLIEALNKLAEAAPAAAAAGLGAVTGRLAYERMVADLLNEAVRELNRSQAAEQMGGLSLILEYRTEFGTIADAVVKSGSGDYISVEIRHSVRKVPLSEILYPLRPYIGPASKPQPIKLLFISNQEPVSTFDIDYLTRDFPGLDYVRMTGAEDLPKVVEAVRSAFRIHA